MISYGQTICWTEFSGDVTTISISRRPSPDLALREAIEFAKRGGWTPQKWWQWWRWNDTRIRS